GGSRAPSLAVMLALYVAPLCPAGHLPHKGGDRQLRVHRSFYKAGDWRKQNGRPISPLVGEMSGRTEGGNVEDHRLPKLRTRPSAMAPAFVARKAKSLAFLPLRGPLLTLQFQPPRVQHRLGIAARLLAALEDEIERGEEGDGVVEVGRHRPIERIAGILAVDYCRHALHRLHDLVA